MLTRRSVRQAVFLAGALSVAVPTTAQLPEPILLAPSGPGQTSNPTYQWRTVSGASSYVLAVERWGNPFYTSPAISHSSCNQTQSLCTFVPPITHTLGFYQWVVVACDSTCQQFGLSDTWSFNVGYPPSSTVTLISPEGNGYGTNPEYEWYPVNDATGYYLYIGATPPIEKIYTNTICGATCAVTPTESLTAGAYAWVAIAINASGLGPVGSANVFTVGVPVESPTPRAPQGLVFTSSPAYQWDEVDGATSYQVALYDAALAPLDLETVSSSTACSNSSCTHVLAYPALPPGVYYWFVRALTSAGGPWSSYTWFYVVNSTPPAPIPQSPEGSGHPANPYYVWSDSGLALQYELQINGAGGAIQKTYAASNVCQGGTCSVTVDLLMPGSYSWSVRATNPLGFGPSSASTNFGVSSPVAGGDHHTLALLPDGAVWSWGAGVDGVLGDGSLQPRLLPGPVPLATGIATIASGNKHNVALKSDHTLLVWGSSNRGQLGIGSLPFMNTPTAGPTFANDVVAIAAGDEHTLALTSDGLLFAWGYDLSGQLGNGSGGPISSNTPVPVSFPVPNAVVVAIAAGGNHSLAVTSDRRVWAWGANASAQIGDGTTVDRHEPAQVDGLSGITAVAAGGFHSVALREDGRVFCWGQGQLGQLGNGTLLPRMTPTLSSVSNVAAVAAGTLHTLAVDRLGKIWAWGSQLNGQVGDGTPGSIRPTPVQLSEPTGIVNVAAGDSHSLPFRRRVSSGVGARTAAAGR
ncbi:MAG: RCC1 domain-containing protein [Vicinamibacteria bacterium]